MPQSHHPHILLAEGLRVLESLFPGLSRQLTSDGAVPSGDYYSRGMSLNQQVSSRSTLRLERDASFRVSDLSAQGPADDIFDNYPDIIDISLNLTHQSDSHKHSVKFHKSRFIADLFPEAQAMIN